MQADLPHTLYIRDRKKGKTGDKTSGFRYNENDPAIKKQMEAIRRAEKRREAQQKGEASYRMDELFRR